MPQCTICLRYMQTITKTHLATKICMAARIRQIGNTYAEYQVKCSDDEVMLRDIISESALSMYEFFFIEWRELVRYYDIPVFVPEVVADDNLHLVMQNRVYRGALTTTGRSARATVLFASSDLKNVIFSYLEGPPEYDIVKFARYANHIDIYEGIPSNEHEGLEWRSSIEVQQMVSANSRAVLRALSANLAVQTGPARIGYWSYPDHHHAPCTILRFNQAKLYSKRHKTFKEHLAVFDFEMDEFMDRLYSKDKVARLFIHNKERVARCIALRATIGRLDWK